MKLKMQYRKRASRDTKRGIVTRLRAWIKAFVRGPWETRRSPTKKRPLTGQVIINYLSRNERRRMRDNLTVPPVLASAAQVVKAVWPISAYSGMAQFHQRTGGRYK